MRAKRRNAIYIMVTGVALLVVAAIDGLVGGFFITPDQTGRVSNPVPNVLAVIAIAIFVVGGYRLVRSFRSRVEPPRTTN
jgi:hypothetical protein